MTSSTTTIKAVKNGTATDAKTPRHDEGIAHVRRVQVHHVTSLAATALYEAERLAWSVISSVSPAEKHYGDEHDVPEPLDLTSVMAILNEAMDCVDLAAEYLSGLNVQLRCLTAAEAEA